MLGAFARVSLAALLLRAGRGRSTIYTPAWADRGVFLTYDFGAGHGLAADPGVFRFRYLVQGRCVRTWTQGGRIPRLARREVTS